MTDLAESWPAEVTAVTPIRHAVIDFARGAGAARRTVDDVALAVTEAVTNAVMHAFAARETPGTVTVLGSVEDHALRFAVSDDGDGMTTHSRYHGLGLGLAIIARLADEVQLGASPSGGTLVTMRFRLANR
jgi:anti-sigma regulatory factor (Ser/Thr protein kinase)